MNINEITFQDAKDAIRWAKSVVDGGYASGSATNQKRKNMKILYRLAKSEFSKMKDVQNDST